jgi:hypothetical protein
MVAVCYNNLEGEFLVLSEFWHSSYVWGDFGCAGMGYRGKVPEEPIQGATDLSGKVTPAPQLKAVYIGWGWKEERGGKKRCWSSHDCLRNLWLSQEYLFTQLVPQPSGLSWSHLLRKAFSATYPVDHCPSLCHSLLLFPPSCYQSLWFFTYSSASFAVPTALPGGQF